MHTLPDLRYAQDALEPWMDARTVEIHHSKHHAKYVSKLNAALEGHQELHDLRIEELLTGFYGLPSEVQGPVRENGGQHANHSLFWRTMNPKGGGEPTGELARAMQDRWASFGAFKEQFSGVAMGHFGSGWAWLSRDGLGRLVIHSTANGDSPIMMGLTPILTLDLWEHAYYLKYQNKRDEFIQAWWNLVDWDEAERNYQAP